MFTGIVEKTAQVSNLERHADSLGLTLKSGLTDLTLGESIAVNGVCLTVSDYHQDGEIVFFVSGETLQRSNLGTVNIGSTLNLERSASLTSHLSGHLVQGHVDATAVISNIEDDGPAKRLSLSLPASLYRYCVEKGSIALNGISMTVNAVSEIVHDRRFTISITAIPHTWNHTNLKCCNVGDQINVEVDILAKYVERLCLAYLKR